MDDNSTVPAADPNTTTDVPATEEAPVVETPTESVPEVTPAETGNTTGDGSGTPADGNDSTNSGPSPV